MKDKKEYFLQKIAPIKDQLPLNYKKVKLVFDSSAEESNKVFFKTVKSTAFSTTQMNTKKSPKWTSRVIQFKNVK